MVLRYAQYKGVVNLDICEEGDAIMADKGFLISDLCTPRGQIDLYHHKYGFLMVKQYKQNNRCHNEK